MGFLSCLLLGLLAAAAAGSAASYDPSTPHPSTPHPTTGPITTTPHTPSTTTPETTTTTRPTTTTEPETTTTTESTTPPGECDFECPEREGLYGDPCDLTKYWQCSNGTPHHMPCPKDLCWNDDIDNCDWYYNVPGCDV